MLGWPLSDCCTICGFRLFSSSAAGLRPSGSTPLKRYHAGMPVPLLLRCRRRPPLHGSYEKDSSQRHFSTSPNSPRRNLPGSMAILPFIGDDHTTTRGCPFTLDAPLNAGGAAALHTRRMLILLSTGVDRTTKRGCPYTLDAPWVSGRINTLPCHLHDLVLRLILNCWEGCLLMQLLHVLFCACLVPLSLNPILSTPRLIGDARSPETLYQIQGLDILCELRSRCSIGCLCRLVLFSF